MKSQVEFPEKLEPIFKPSRYKVLYGGRGGAKSWAIARALLSLGSKSPLRILCARELQKSIKDSVHRLLSDQINNLKLNSFYEIQHATIKGKNGTEFFFEGLRHNTNQIKSYEGVDIVWVEEAVTVSKSSWDVLIPTIRKEGSEIWISFNPELEEDETYQRFVVNPPKESIVIDINYWDNPWFPEVLRQEMEELKERNHSAYLNVWEGRCKQAVDGAIYYDEMTQIVKEGRITVVPYNPRKAVCTFWDLGYGDETAIWFIQKEELRYHVIDFYQNARKLIQHYITVLQNKGYIYSTHYLPHDGRNNYLVGESVESTLQGIGWKVGLVDRPQRKIDGLNAVRTVFPMLWFDKDKCADGLTCLRRYHYKVDAETGKTGKEPEHDENSNGADAMQTFALEPNVQWEIYVDGGHGEFKSNYDPFEAGR